MLIRTRGVDVMFSCEVAIKAPFVFCMSVKAFTKLAVANSQMFFVDPTRESWVVAERKTYATPHNASLSILIKLLL